MSLAELRDDALTLSSMTRKRWEFARDHSHSIAGHLQLLPSPARSRHTRRRPNFAGSAWRPPSAPLVGLGGVLGHFLHPFAKLEHGAKS
jgi:hypothetical protein